MPKDKADPLAFRGITISHAERPMFADPPVTKGDVARYYDQIGDRMLPHLRARAISLLRFPEGIASEGFFQKHKGPGFSDAIAAFPEGNSDVMRIDTVAGLIAAAQMSGVEFHIRNTQLDKPDLPDRLVFDLDPDTAVGFAGVKSAAIILRGKLADLGLPSHPMVTGGKGVHVIVPLRRSADTETVEGFAKAFAHLIAESQPDRFTATMSKDAREGRIFVDWLRNTQQATAVCPWSLRGRAGASVATLVSWEELARLNAANSFGMAVAMTRKEPAAPKPVALTAKVVAALNR